MNNKITIQQIFLFGIFFLLFFLIVYMMTPFATVLLWTCLLYILIRPLFHKVSSRIQKEKKFYNFKRQLCAIGFSLGTLLLIIGPITTIIYMLIQQGISFLQSAENYISNNPNSISSSAFLVNIKNFFNQIGYDLPMFSPQEFESYLMELIQTYSTKLFSLGTGIISKTGSFIMSLVFIIFALYFCFLDGDYLISLIRKAIPIKHSYMDILIKRLSDITKNLFSGYVLVALYQGLAAFIIMLCFGIPGALLFSVILMFASFVPIFGAALIWAPIGIVICITDSIIKGIFFLIISGFCISFLDNFLRPFFLKDRINVHPLVIFFSILGGVTVFGLNGLILGPLVVILFFTVIDLIITQKSNTQNESKGKDENKDKLENK